jgi:uncharacterized protein YlxW (UPF0749 family)
MILHLQLGQRSTVQQLSRVLLLVQPLQVEAQAWQQQVLQGQEQVLLQQELGRVQERVSGLAKVRALEQLVILLLVQALRV